MLASGFTDVGAARSLISTVQSYVVIDSRLTVATMLEYFGVLVGIDPAALFGYTVESTSAMVSGNSVQIPSLDSPTMLAVLDVFAGRAALPDAPIEQPIFLPSAATATARVEAPIVPPVDMTC